MLKTHHCESFNEKENSTWPTENLCHDGEKNPSWLAPRPARPSKPDHHLISGVAVATNFTIQKKANCFYHITK